MSLRQLIRPNKKKYVWFRLHPEKIRLGRLDTIFFLLFFSWNIQTCFEIYQIRQTNIKGSIFEDIALF